MFVPGQFVAFEDANMRLQDKVLNLFQYNQIKRSHDQITKDI